VLSIQRLFEGLNIVNMIERSGDSITFYALFHFLDRII